MPLTDQATIDWRFYRHDDVITVLMIARDPVYLVEPEIVSKSFRLSPRPLDYRTPCVPGYEGREPGDGIPHFAPDQNPFADEFIKFYSLPREAVLGYPETLYPEYRKKIRGHLRAAAAVQGGVRPGRQLRAAARELNRRSIPRTLA